MGGRFQYLAFIALFAGAYFVAATLSLLLAIPPGYATAVWPPSDIALAVLLRFGVRFWPGIWPGAALTNYSVDLSVAAAFALALDLRTAIEQNQAQITQDPLPPVRADARLLEQVFRNLLGNAIKFRGVEPPRIHVCARREGEDWIFSVRDNGIGVDAKYFPIIFQMFQRLNAQSNYPGSGIGLAICKRAVETHGGRIWIESAPGAGAVFHFSLPDS